MSNGIRVVLCAVAILAAATACAAPATPAPVPPTEAPIAAPTATEAPAEPVGEVLDLPGELAGMTWDDVLAEADGQTVRWWQWGGNDKINAWITGWVADHMKELYNVTVELVPVTDASQFVNKVMGEKDAGRDTGGSVDLMWINGENFRTMKQANLTYGPWAKAIPNTMYHDWDDFTVAYDQGFPTDGHEHVYARMQYVVNYDTAKVPDPPKTIPDLVEWIKANPGKFTYSALPDFTGGTFVRHLFYYYGGGVDNFMGDFDEALYLEKSPKLWEVLNEIEPYLWREGQTYPETVVRVRELFANGEVYFNPMSGSNEASMFIESGAYPTTAASYCFEGGTESGTNFLGIAYNSPNKAGTLALVNFLVSPEAVYERAKPDVWGTMPALDLAGLSPEWQQKFAEIPLGVATQPTEYLQAHAIPQVQSTWRVRLEQDWVKYVLQQ